MDYRHQDLHQLPKHNAQIVHVHQIFHNPDVHVHVIGQVVMGGVMVIHVMIQTFHGGVRS